MGFIQGNLPVFSKAAMSGDTQHLWVYVLNGELFCRNCIHFILQRETNVFQIACCCLDIELLQIFCGNIFLTSRNDVVEVCRRISVL